MMSVELPYTMRFDAKLNGYMETVQCRLVFYGIIGCLEVDAKNVTEFIPYWGDEVYTYPSAIEIEGPTKYMV
jgi:hypothetical protein